MKDKPVTETEAIDLLQGMLDRAVKVGVDTVDLERVPEGLEILHGIGHTVAGGLLVTSET